MSANDIPAVIPVAGEKNVAIAGTPERLSATPIQCSAVIITARPGNTGAIAYGETSDIDATASAEVGAILGPGQSVTYPTRDVSNLWIDAAVSGEGVSFSTVVR